MKKSLFLSLSLAAALSLGGCSLSGAAQNPAPAAPAQNVSPAAGKPPAPVVQTQTPPAETPANPPAQTVKETPAVKNPPAAIENKSVKIENFSFSPETLTVKKGATVTWINNDSAPHALKSGAFSSSALDNGQSYSQVFNEAGTFNYSCSIHPSMKGVIIVE